MQLNLLEYLEQSAARMPAKTAFTDESERLTFGGLLCRARSLGTAIARRTRGTNRPVAVLAGRRAATVAAFQGVLMSGNYYVPIDPKMPQQRMEKILSQVRPEIIVCAAGDRAAAEQVLIGQVSTEQAMTGQASTEQASTGQAMTEQASIGQVSTAILTFEEGFAQSEDPVLLGERRAAVLDIDPAYMIFTSGSTGRPKGIVVAHRSVIDFCDWMADYCGITEQDIMGNQAPFYFDLSVKDLYLTLKCGASCEIVPQKNYVFPLLLLRYLDEKGVTVLLWATSAFHLTANSGALAKCAPKSIRLAALGGEALQAKQVNIWKSALPELTVINLYGPTEVTVDCTAYKLDRPFADDETIPIGTACRNKQIILLDEGLQPVADGQPGEICVRGTGLARGYFRDADKTAAAFIQNPLNPDYPDLLYRTGDLAVRGKDGLLRFLTRRDGQIKHMGYRIELGEIEAALVGLPSVDAAVCLYDAEKGKILCIYTGSADDRNITSANGDRNITSAESDAIAKEMRTRVPKYMLPNIYHKRDSLPLNPNGKIDRVRLKAEYLGADK